MYSNPVNRFFRKIKKMIAWFPVIWKDEDYDQAFIYDLLRFKLKRMISLFEKFEKEELPGCYVGISDDILDMQRVYHALCRLHMDDYSTYEYDKLEHKKYVDYTDEEREIIKLNIEYVDREMQKDLNTVANALSSGKIQKWWI